ncbi:MAG: Uma2 family endonuclease [Candidatus Obscuribacterales bacterium]|jgi:Uma2 family endonuclease|nr:Uma2 family endonuclease [Candidatus Obscuribacterales bacterium]
MVLPAKRLTVSVDEYLVAELASEVKHEYVNGQIYAMASASKAHNLITLNIASFLKTKIRAGACCVFVSNIKVHVEQSHSFYYPDIVVDSGPILPSSVTATKPVLIVEVLSQATLHIDKREKLAAYRGIESLREYLIVYQDTHKIEHYIKDFENNWSQTIIEGGVVFIRAMSRLGCEIEMPTMVIYEDIEC